MMPVLFYIGKVPISSLGVFLTLGFLYALFLVWRLARAWDIDEEKILDLLLLTAIFAVIGARVYFVLVNFSFFAEDFTRIIYILKYPGFSFWGAFLGGWLALNYFTKKLRLDFWTVADIASVGFLASMIFGNIGCFMSGCGYGIPYSGICAVDMTGQVGTRFPVQILEAGFMALLLWNIWPKATHFHTPGKILSLVLIYVGIIKLATEMLRANSLNGEIFAVLLIVLGLMVFYKVERRSLRKDVVNFKHDVKEFFVDAHTRKVVLQNFKRSCYNFFAKEIKEKKVSWQWKINKLLRKINVKPTPKNY